MYPIYVLEGPDGSGKTTLGKELAHRHQAHYMHLTYRWPKRMFTYHTAALERAIKIAQTRPVVIDRWWPSINIYDLAFRGKLTFEMAGRMLDRAGLANGIVYVVCLPSDHDKHLAMFDERKAKGQEMYDSVVEVIDAYTEWYNVQMAGREDVIRYDWMTDGQDLNEFCLKMYRRSLQINNRIPHWFWQNRQYAGNVWRGNPTVMIVGERSNPKGRHAVWPFFEHGLSSLWLTEALQEAGIEEYDIVWANAINIEGWTQPAALKQLWNETHPFKVVALGRKAEGVLHTAGLSRETEMLPHPAYAKRFLNGDRGEYLETFGRIAKNAREWRERNVAGTAL